MLILMMICMKWIFKKNDSNDNGNIFCVDVSDISF